MKISLYIDWSEDPADNLLAVNAFKISYEPGQLIIHAKDNGPDSVYKKVVQTEEGTKVYYTVPLDKMMKLVITDEPILEPVREKPLSELEGVVTEKRKGRKPFHSNLVSVDENLRYLTTRQVINARLNGKLRAVAVAQGIEDWQTFLQTNTKSTLTQYEGISEGSISIIEAVYKRYGLVLAD